jgi:hybrid polyketide synthase/nonribosomal peptide synthetase FtdB
VPLAAVFRCPTVRQLAGYLLDVATHGIPLADETLVCLGGPAGARSVFAFPPGTGDVLSYIALAERLPRHRLYAFNFIEADTRLDDYADLVVQTDPLGPHVLLGYSSGGNLAYHVAGVLESRGRSVRAVVMVDAARSLSAYPYHHDQVMQVARDYLDHEAIRPYCASPVLRDKVVRRIVAAYRLLSRTTDDHTISADIHVLLQGDQRLETLDGGRVVASVPAWAAVTRRGLRTYQGAGDHNHMLADRALDTNARILGEILDALTGEAGAP